MIINISKTLFRVSINGFVVSCVYCILFLYVACSSMQLLFALMHTNDDHVVASVYIRFSASFTNFALHH
jgi:hypothetical protein